jgi:hypothetical protein
MISNHIHTYTYHILQTLVVLMLCLILATIIPQKAFGAMADETRPEQSALETRTEIGLWGKIKAWVEAQFVPAPKQVKPIPRPQSETALEKTTTLDTQMKNTDPETPVSTMMLTESTPETIVEPTSRNISSGAQSPEVPPQIVPLSAEMRKAEPKKELRDTLPLGIQQLKLALDRIANAIAHAKDSITTLETKIGTLEADGKDVVAATTYINVARVSLITAEKDFDAAAIAIAAVPKESPTKEELAAAASAVRVAVDSFKKTQDDIAKAQKTIRSLE